MSCTHARIMTFGEIANLFTENVSFQTSDRNLWKCYYNLFSGASQWTAFEKTHFSVKRFAISLIAILDDVFLNDISSICCSLFPIQPLHTSRFLVSNIEARVKKLEEEKNLNASKGGFWDEFEVRSLSYNCGSLWVIGIVSTRLVCTYPCIRKPCNIQNIYSQYVLDVATLTQQYTRYFFRCISAILSLLCKSFLHNSSMCRQKQW